MISTVVKVALPVNEMLDVRKHRLGTDGKRLSIVTGIHGDELEGQYVCYELARRISAAPQLLTGIVDLYPALNPLGIDTVTRGIPAFDLDMNRIFPGRQDGDMNEYVASRIIEDLSGSELCIDIHASNIYLTEIPQIRINELHRDTVLPLARLANVDFVWVHGASTVLEATLAHSLNVRGTKTLVVEMGVGMRITRRYGDQLVDGLFRLMKELGIWQGSVCEVRRPVISENPADVVFLNAPLSGVFLKGKEHGGHVYAGESIGQIVDPLRGIVLCEVTAPKAGWLFTIREYPMVSEGSLMARILSADAFARETAREADGDGA
ncbi:MAG: M14 family metallopeptidase [Eubacteriales bacterium]|nr:M14 family metallopeptidase [Eubacteriales bacterium]